MSINDSSAGSPLGKRVAYETQYNPTLLYPIPRAEKRAELGITNVLPFVGADIWNAYELSWLNPRGKPLVALAEFSFPADSPCIIESKSLKLYLNSYNQTKLGSLEEVEGLIAADLGKATGATAAVKLTSMGQASTRRVEIPKGICLDDIDIDVDAYTPAPELLQSAAGTVVVDETLYSHLLKSNCLVTAQPDWGMLAIRYSGPAVDHEALLRYIISFREHNEFHEQCVERIFCDIQRRCSPKRLAVWARYTRRGGLDINPIRATDGEWSAVGNLAEARQ
jgi:7-cyano-7-deazaguanine reductase